MIEPPAATPGQFTFRVEAGGITIDPPGALPAIEVVDASGERFGTLYGTAIDLDAGRIVAGKVTLAAALGGAPDLDALVEAEIYRFTGTFLFVLDCRGVRRIYIDAAGTKPVVFGPDLRKAGSTAGVLLDREHYRARFERERYEYLHILEDGWFPTGLTAHRGVERLLINHYLDLDNWTQHRHWPKVPIAITADPDAVADHVTGLVGRTVSALLDSGKTVATTLTGGGESRLMLASFHDLRERLDFYTIAGPGTELDVRLASKLAKRFGLKHHLLPIVLVGADEAAAWHARTGHVVGGRIMTNHRSVEPMAERDFQVGGLGGEVARAFFWRSGDVEATEISARSMAARLGMPIDGAVVDRIADWLRGIAPIGLDPFALLDLAYLEMRVGPWCFASAYAHPEAAPQIHPLISRAVFTAMLSLPPDWRRTSRLTTRGIERRWPELLSIPINKDGLYHLLKPIRKVIKHPRLVAKKLRKLFG